MSHHRTTIIIALLLPSLWAQAQNGGPATQPSVESIPDTLVKFTMLYVPGGTLQTADPEGKAIEVAIKPFWLGRTEVTWDEYDIFAFRLDLPEKQRNGDAESRPSKPYGAPDFGFGHQGYPCLAITFHSAQMYCKWLSAKTGRKYRLPTEAEWEWACRAGRNGDARPDKETLKEIAWYVANSGEKSQAVAQLKPNGWGFYDMLGNAGEWCVTDKGTGVLRGGTWRDGASHMHPGKRALQAPSWNSTDPQDPKSKWWLSDGTFVSFRIVREE